MNIKPAVHERLGRVRHVALDMDGTIYNGSTLFPFTLPFLGLLGELGIEHTFLTNNSSKSTRDYLSHLSRLGISTTDNQIYTSTQATIAFLRREYGEVRRLFVLGTASVSAEFVEAGFILSIDDASDEP